MGVTRAQLAFLVLVVFVTFFSSQNVSGAEMEKKFSYDHCTIFCSADYEWHECWVDCLNRGYHNGDCASPSPNVPKKCCCQT
ncbi:unnamed protein product [Eruca vesicaria subsp. sativa]|uniref:Defensin-like domain-containing protein n=1 Tax=Eruca vesicaria subsp. sativa TaxID=29727 RepID=A0ABC8L033_ERUVS|nr:unnamed protein product [Eruca vesicaria subsp. sativa]